MHATGHGRHARRWNLRPIELRGTMSKFVAFVFAVVVATSALAEDKAPAKIPREAMLSIEVDSLKLQLMQRRFEYWILPDDKSSTDTPYCLKVAEDGTITRGSK